MSFSIKQYLHLHKSIFCSKSTGLMASLELKVDEGVLNFTSSNFIGIGGLSGILGSV